MQGVCIRQNCTGRQPAAQGRQTATAAPRATASNLKRTLLPKPHVLAPCRRTNDSRKEVLTYAAYDANMGMDPELKKSIDDLIANNTVVVFMKGNRQFPQCGFSNTVVQILNVMGVRYETVDILADTRLRSGMKVYSQWPTFPQVYINGEFFGGCDIMIEAYQSGELKEMLEVAMNS